MTDATLATIDQADDDQPRHERINPTGAVAQVFPPDARDALVLAAKMHDTDAIDVITDRLAERGFCRPRHDKGLFTSRSPAAR